MTLTTTMQAKKTAMRRIRCIHFVGIGGAGMCGIAEVLLNLGYRISGSDKHQSANTKRLAEKGARIFYEHQMGNISHADVVVVSSAIDETNPEIQAAHQLRIPVVPRAQMLAELMRFRQGIAIAGTHGKTTTTSLTASLLAEAGLDPTFVIGGKLNSAGANARLGSGEYLVAEADESDASFLYLQPTIAVVTNIDADHLSTYKHDFNNLKTTFIEFLHHLPFYGLAVMCIDDKIVREILPEINRPVVTYGTHQDADVRAVDIQYRGAKSEFNLLLPDDSQVPISLNMPGLHNVQNALAALAVAHELGVQGEVMHRALVEFAGIGRRFSIYGDLALPIGSITLVDDYGHHPREMAATIAAARQAYPNRRLVVVFQPHRYSRTAELFEDFCQVLAAVDALCLCEVYSAGEAPIQTATGRALCKAIRARNQVNPVFVADLAQVGEILINMLKDNDVLLTLGAGNIGQLSQELPELLTQLAGAQHA